MLTAPYFPSRTLICGEASRHRAASYRGIPPLTFPYNLPGAAPYRPLPPLTTRYRPPPPLTALHCPSPPFTAPYRPSLPLTAPHYPLGAAGHRFVLSSPKAVPRARLLQLLKGKYPAFRLVDEGTPTTRTLSPTLTLTYPYLYS